MQYLKTISFFLFLALTSSLAFSHGISEQARMSMIEGGALRYLILGAEHMLTGYDHLLFLFGVVFFLTSFKDIVKFISVFTLGHSITLIFATFLKITANYYLIDAVIALSVCYKGFDNLGGFQKHLGMKSSPNLLWAVFIFGLIHGFGLSARLQQLPLPHDTSSLLANIISFNVGVELGQITALIFMLLFLEWARKLSSFHLFSKLSNAGLILAGALLFLMQMHGYQHEKYPDDHGFSKDLHMHHHEDLEEMENAPSRHDSLESEGENESEEHGHHHGEGHGESHHHEH